jgi:methionine-rich copper-binding protein CopC
MAYDSQSDSVILFGGWDGSTNYNDTWAYDFNSNKWTQMNPQSAPSPRGGVPLAYDSQSDLTVLFGGGNFYNDTWTYDFNSDKWMNVTSSYAPPGRRYHFLAYDLMADRVVTFGGFSNNNNLGDTWTYDANSNKWTDMNPSPAPANRRRYGLAYDSESDRTILFGGWTTQNASDTWAYHYGDLIPPFVVSTSPSNGSTNVSVSAQVNITWSEGMNQSATEGAVSFSPSVICAWSWTGVNMACTHSTNLQNNTKYMVTISTAAKDSAGNAMLAPHVFSFNTTVGGGPNPPTVLSTNPANNSNNVPLNSKISITFSEPMNMNATEYAFSSVPSLICTFTWVAGEMTMHLTPSVSFPMNTLYTITISTTAKSKAGVNMQNPYVFSFTTAPSGLIPPNVNATTPSNSSSNVALNTNIVLTFSEAMDKSATQTAISSLPTITGTFSWDTAAKVVTWDPTSDLQPNTKYTVTVGVGAKSQVGANMKTPFIFSFTTGIAPDVTPPTVTSTNPANGATDVDKGTKVTITFSEPMDASATEGAVSISPGSITKKEWNANGTVMTLTATLEDATKYAVVVSTTAKDTAGNAMVAAYAFSFTTQSSGKAVDGIGFDPWFLIVIIVLVIIIAMLLILLLQARRRTRCPGCKESIPKDKDVCPFCGYDLVRKTSTPIAATEEGEKAMKAPEPEPLPAEDKKSIEADEEPKVSKDDQADNSRERLENIRERRRRVKKE